MSIVDTTDERDEWDEDEDDDDIDAEAEEIARRLGAELWADIRKAKEAAASPSTDLVPTLNDQKDNALATVRDILHFVELDEVARSVLASTSIPGPGSETVLSALQKMATSGAISKEVALPLSTVLLELVKSETLFSSLRHSNVPYGKRKRDESGEYPPQTDDRPYKRSYVPETDLQSRVEEAVRTIAQALGSPGAKTLDPAVISTIRLQLHQVFLFAVTSSAVGGHDMHALQEIGGLIQVIGVLSGIQIGQTPDGMNGQNSQSFGVNPAYPWLHNQTPGTTTDIGTAVYPCLFTGCGKTFSRLYSLRGHQRLHTVRRPFRCNVCPASFVRNHDLKRHIRVHENKAWKCGGCSKVFSRRDAIKRHKNGSRARGPKAEVCVDADVLEVELDGEEEESVREERRAKLWSGIAVNQSSGAASTPHRDDVEEGEIRSSLISDIQATVLGLHGLLQAHVGNALGTAVSPSAASVDATGSQATLASVIARAQLQNLPHNPMSEAIEGASSEYPVSLQPSGQPGAAQSNPTGENQANDSSGVPTLPALSMYGLSDEQTRLLEEAIAKAASAAQAQAEAEAALEEQDANEDYEQEDEDYDGSEVQAEADDFGDGK